jgi:hypothetical protein
MQRIKKKYKKKHEIIKLKKILITRKKKSLFESIIKCEGNYSA